MPEMMMVDHWHVKEAPEPEMMIVDHWGGHVTRRKKKGRVSYSRAKRSLAWTYNSMGM